ncbi:flagellar hook-associated protein FlgK [Pararhodobacter sp. CCB-MM2]|uniref:flagellar hook-associated protein FlgK n=1 Tax=Pararhodobacter sp. CCB-MM2 TaxID=1786003 RepID=UPI00082C255C|nr:flagellar hook-associated protein FlgK [Pararhodobacter sp. CCB-MM2]MCA2011603.1 flagellar hook-associated protein FlgK [Cereibacter sphaeroides]
MSISSALNNANSGLAASARAVQVASSNIANVLTPGYAARRLDLASSSLGGVGSGVRVAGTTRIVDPVVLGMHRDAGASASAGGTSASFWNRIQSAIGLTGEGLSSAMSGFESALISASERPDLESRLSGIVNNANALVSKLGQIEDAVQQTRVEADNNIAVDVKALNEGLQRVDTLNDQIIKMKMSGQSTLGLEDERQSVISTLSEIVPMREYPRDNGRVMLYSTNGELLLDTQPVTFGFTQTVAIDASMSNGSGLSGLTINGRAISTTETGPLGGGRLSTNFNIRDVDAPGVQAEIDAFASDLISRFADPATDATLAGGPGLFTDAGTLDTGVAGLAGRLAVNTAVDPSAGGALWRLRDGIGAAAAGPVGDATQINNLMGALDRSISSGPGAPMRDVAGNLGGLLTSISTARQGAEDSATTAQTRFNTLNDSLLEQGVDTDAEMQRLLLIEEAYAANARVISTADAMLRTLLEI